MNETEFSDKEDNPVLLGHLHCNREIICRFCREEYIHSLLGENRVRGLMIYLDDVQLEKYHVMTRNKRTGMRSSP